MSVNNADKIKSPALSALLVLGAGCLWGFMGLLVRSTDSLGLDSMDICFLRALVTSAVVLSLTEPRSSSSYPAREVYSPVTSTSATLYRLTGIAISLSS